jgi:hypothetical protein
MYGEEPGIDTRISLSMVPIGRPFSVGGEVRRARVASTRQWGSAAGQPSTAPADLRGRIADGWAEAGCDEHASVAAFARFILELLAVGAPSDLVADATRAQADEVVHARMCFEVASRIGDDAYGPGPLDIRGALRDFDPRRVLLDAVREGCIGETIAAAQAATARDLAQDAEIKAVLDRIATDESRHAALSWQFVRWMLERYPEWRVDVVNVLTNGWRLGPRPEKDPGTAVLHAFGRLTDRAQHDVARQVLSQVIRPCAESLLAGLNAG